MKRFSLRNMSIELIVGAFFFAALVILAYFTIILSKDTFFERQRPVVLHFSEVGGLTEGDTLRLRGVRVGTVDRVRLENSDVYVEAMIQEQVKLFADASAQIHMSSVLGGRYVAIDQGDPETGPLPDGTAIPGREPADILMQVSEVMDEIRTEIRRFSAAFEDNDLLPKLADAVDNFQAISEQLREGRGTLGKLLVDPSLYNNANAALASVQNAGDSVTKTADAVTTTVNDARAGQGTLGKLLTDDALYTETTGLVTGLRAGQGSLGKLLTEDALYDNVLSLTTSLRETTESLFEGDSSLARLANDQGELFHDLSGTFSSTREITEHISAGRGSLGKLVRDDALYEELRRAIQDVRAAIEDFREQAPISTFGGLIFGAF